MNHVQVGIVQAAFSPSKAEVEAAMRLVAAFKEHQDKGHGAFVFEGRLPSIKCLRSVCTRSLCVLTSWGRHLAAY